MTAILHRQTRAVIIEGTATVAHLAEVAVESGVSLAYADLSNANLAGAMLPSADFSHASLVGANLTDAYLGRADFREADLRATDFTGSFYGGADFDGAEISYARGLRTDPLGARRNERPRGPFLREAWMIPPGSGDGDWLSWPPAGATTDG